jgi:RNA polymerase sigma factor (sigma-70 family)
MKNKNPFHGSYDYCRDTELINKALKGDKKSLSDLIQQNQGYIYNVALKMFNSIEDAEDLTQEVLIKIITNLASYNSTKSQFRTWAYRIAFNHFLNRKKAEYEKAITNFGDFFSAIESVPEINLSDEEESEMKLLVSESKVSCMAGMLMCLDREQRLIYIVGEIFEIDHQVASEIFQITPDNFRQKLSRTRKDLYQWMNNKCGLVNNGNPCRCNKKTKGFIANGWVNPDTMKWHSDYKQSIYKLSHEKIDAVVSAWEDVYANLYREHPFKNCNSAEKVLAEILSNKTIRESFNLN